MDLRQLTKTVWRRKRWLFARLSPGKAVNLARASKDFALKRETTKALPAVVKIDISPVCNLKCTMCIHSDGNGSDLIDRQKFSRKDRMSVEHFGHLIEQLRGKTTAVSLYTWGDPLTHPDLEEMCRIAARAGLQVHISTNYSFNLSDERIRGLVESGLTHLTVCVDGLTQEKYEKTRVGGRIKWVLENLRRTCEIRKELNQSFPLIEVQYIKFQHNVDEVEKAKAMVEAWGVDNFATFWGALHNLSDVMPQNYPLLGPKPNQRIPRCFWPHFSMVVKYNGDVIPCCEHRAAAQHAPGADARTLGNVFESSVEEIWNSKGYQQTRRLVGNPELQESEPELRKTYCDGCFVINETGIEQTRRWANKHSFDELFTVNAKGRPERRPGFETGLPT